MNKANEKLYLNWVNEGLNYLEILKKDPTNQKARITVDTCAAVACIFDRKHEREETQILQSYVWEQGYLSGECDYERYLNSGYFKKKYRKKA